MLRTRAYAGAVETANCLESLCEPPDLDGVVVDDTGLQGNFTFTLWAAPQAALTGAPPADAPDIFTAVRNQLGLKLERTTVEGRVLVVDQIERPTEN
jgi:uncharacterized protein (TIGR03435 family)